MATGDAETKSATVGELVPVAKDGSWFGPHVGRGGVFQIGEKGAEIRVTGYEAALAQLRTMSPPRWRRPNRKGNWGIVSGVDWIVPLDRPEFCRHSVAALRVAPFKLYR